MTKLFVITLAFLGAFIIQWYGNFTGRLPNKGSFLGMHYDSPYVQAFFTQLRFVWVLILVNFLYSLMFKVGFQAFGKNFLALTSLWLATGPIVALIISTLVLKEKVTFLSVTGLVLILAGGILVVAHKEVAALFNH